MTKSSGPRTEPWGTRCYARCKNINPTINKRSNLFETSFLFLHVPAVSFLSCYFLPYLHPLSSPQFLPSVQFEGLGYYSLCYSGNRECPYGYTKCEGTGTDSSRRCIRSSWLCDGDNDCGNNWDEAPEKLRSVLLILLNVVSQLACFFLNFYSCSSVYFTFSIIAMPLL